MFTPLRTLPEKSFFTHEDIAVIFGEVFDRGYVNGIIEELKFNNIPIIYSTVGRRDQNKKIRALTEEELAERYKPLINVPLETGFDLFQPEGGENFIDQLKNIDLNSWKDFKIPIETIEDISRQATLEFKSRLKMYFEQLKPHLKNKRKILFIHTMAGGIPRAKIILVLMNRVFKASGDRFISSKDFWNGSDLGRLCLRNFQDVTAESFFHLIEHTEDLRNNHEVSYIAYGYHGNEVLIGDSYKWQSYTPYLQGFAKLRLEEISLKAYKKGLQVCVFNVPEILTNSTTVFSGVELALFNLIGSLEKKASLHPWTRAFQKLSKNFLKDEFELENIFQEAQKYFTHPNFENWNNFNSWPDHSRKEQLNLMQLHSKNILNMHKSKKELVAALLSQLVFRVTGHIIYRYADKIKNPVCWIGHEMITENLAQVEGLEPPTR